MWPRSLAAICDPALVIVLESIDFSPEIAPLKLANYFVATDGLILGAIYAVGDQWWILRWSEPGDAANAP